MFCATFIFQTLSKVHLLCCYHTYLLSVPKKVRFLVPLFYYIMLEESIDYFEKSVFTMHQLRACLENHFCNLHALVI